MNREAQEKQRGKASLTKRCADLKGLLLSIMVHFVIQVFIQSFIQQTYIEYQAKWLQYGSDYQWYYNFKVVSTGKWL